jgi:hypothetical protein
MRFLGNTAEPKFAKGVPINEVEPTRILAWRCALPGTQTMWSFSRDAAAAAGIIGCFVLVTAIQGGGGFSREATDDSTYETTGSIGSIKRAILPLSEQQRERIHQGLMRFPDAARGEQAPVLADRVPSEQPLQDLPANLTQEIPPLHGHKFLKLSDRILLVDPTSREVVAMIPRYRLLP